MNPKTKELWVIPTIIAIATGIPLAAGFMFLSMWLAGTPINASFSLEWIKVALFTSLPMWVTFAVLAVATIITGLFFRQRAKTAEERAQWVSAIHSLESAENRIAKLNEEHAAEIEKLKAKEPRLHGVWNQSQAFWHMGRQGEAPGMQIGGWIDLTSSNTKEVMFLLAAYIGERRSQMFIEVEVKPNVVNRCMVMLFMVPPLETDAEKPYEATIVVEDQYNRKFSLPLQRFRTTPGQNPFPTSVPGKPAPKLHVGWRGNSGWCWAQHEGERVLRISGDGPILLENVQEKVIITGVLIEGAEFVGVFNNFELGPGEPTFRGMNLDFKGINPVDKEPVTVKLTFLDLRGNKYPTNETTFKPLSLPNQYGGLPWPRELRAQVEETNREFIRSQRDGQAPVKMPTSNEDQSSWPDVILECQWPSLVHESKIPGSHTVRKRPWTLRHGGPGAVYNVCVHPIDFGAYRATFLPFQVPTLTNTASVHPIICRKSDGLVITTHDLESLIHNPASGCDVRQYAIETTGTEADEAGRGDFILEVEIPVMISYDDKNGNRFKIKYLLRYDTYMEKGEMIRIGGIEKVAPVV